MAHAPASAKSFSLLAALESPIWAVGVCWGQGKGWDPQVQAPSLALYPFQNRV